VLTSYNGWTASANPADFGGLEPLVIDGESFAPGVRAGDVALVFRHFWTDFSRHVEPLVRADWHQADDWGYAFRRNRNANNLSCHASATATDGNATRHPNGKRGTFSADQANSIRYLCKVKYRGLLRWGGDFTGTPDEMHVEIIGTPGQIAALAMDLRGGPSTPPPASSEVTYEQRDDAPLGKRVLYLGKVGSDVGFVQRWLGIADDDHFGPATRDRVREYQEQRGLKADAVVGPNTWAAMGIDGPVTLPEPDPAPQPWLMLPAVRSRPKSFQTWYNRYPFKPALLPTIRPVANNFGPQSLAALKKVQKRFGLKADGIDGPVTKKLLWNLGWRG
jgi:peptidoglycan hydrolase-like protein with peptidoglycan-binding domain